MIAFMTKKGEKSMYSIEMVKVSQWTLITFMNFKLSRLSKKKTWAKCTFCLTKSWLPGPLEESSSLGL